MKRTRSMIVVPVLAGCLTLLAACGGSGSGGDGGSDGGTNDSELVSIAITPENTTLLIDGSSPATAAYTAIGTFADGTTADVTQDAVFTVDRASLARFMGSTLTTTVSNGGRTSVRATLGSVVGITGLTIQISQRHADPEITDLPEDPGSLFEGQADETRAPRLVYPSDGVLLPPNLRLLEVHFFPGEGNELFELSFASETSDIKVYTRCAHPLNGGCIYTLDQDVWWWVAESNRGGSPVTLTVRGTDSDGTAVGESAPLTLSFSSDNIEGGIYYWTTSDTQDSSTAIMRYDFASELQAEPERFIGTEMTGGLCVGCHALSPSGETLLTASNSSYNANVLLVNVRDRTPLVPFNSSPASAFSSWNPDGTRYVGVFANEETEGFVSYDLNIFDGTNGELIETIPVGGTEENPTSHPDWSPAGDRIAYTRVGIANTQSGTVAFSGQSSLRIIENDSSGWGEPIVLTEPVPGQSTYYPTFSPTGEILVFNRSSCANGADDADCDAYDDPGATLFVMRPEAGAEAIELGRANAPGLTDTEPVVQNSYPKWSPFTFRRDSEFDTRLHWLTFSSDRNYGLREPQQAHTLIWMAGVDPDAALRGEDPSYPAFALPFQDLTTDNHTAQWTQRVIVVE